MIAPPPPTAPTAPTRAPSARAPLALALTAVAALGLTGCAAEALPPEPSASPSASAAAADPAPEVTPLPAGAGLDYQLGGAYDPPAGVDIVVRDRTDSPAAGLYSICYVNAFQTQPGEADAWPDGLLLRDGAGEPVIDPDWPDEVIVDTRDAAAVAGIVTPWIRGCAADGFDAVEFDNLDTYTRTGGALSRDDNLAVATLLVRAAHDAGLAAGQKNAAEDAALLREIAGFDFAVTEECSVYDECGVYAEVYGDAVLGIEYPDTLAEPFADACAAADRPRSFVLRDRELTTPGDPAYVFALCD